MRDRAVELDEKSSEALAPRRSRDAGAVARVGGAGAPRRTSKKCIRRSSSARDTPEASAADESRRRKRRAGRGKSQFADVNFPGRRSAGERARARRATYLDLGRLEGGDRAGEGGGNAGHFGVVKGCGVWCVCGNGRFDRGGPMFGTLRFCQLGRFFACSLSSIWRSSHVFPAKTLLRAWSRLRANRDEQNRASPPKGVSRDFQVARQNRHLELRIKIDIAFFPFKRAMNQYRHRVFPFQTRDFAKPAPGETSRVKKTQIPDRFSDELAISVRSWLFQRVSVGASRPMSDGRFESVCPW